MKIVDESGLSLVGIVWGGIKFGKMEKLILNEKLNQAAQFNTQKLKTQN